GRWATRGVRALRPRPTPHLLVPPLNPHHPPLKLPDPPSMHTQPVTRRLRLLGHDPRSCPHPRPDPPRHAHDLVNSYGCSPPPVTIAQCGSGTRRSSATRSPASATSSARR